MVKNLGPYLKDNENEKMEITFRKLEKNDFNEIYKWRMDKYTQQTGFHIHDLNNHINWMKEGLEEKNTNVFVLFDGLNKIGTVRFDNFIKNKKRISEIGIIIAPEHRKKGYSVKAIKILSSYYLNINKTDIIYARIKKENNISKNIFKKAGYILGEDIFDDEFKGTYHCYIK